MITALRCDEARGVTGSDGWFGLRESAAERRGGVTKLAHAAGGGGGETLAALGVPPGCVLTVLPDRTFAVREVLGSASPLRLSASAMADWAGRRDARRANLAVERERLAMLANLQQLEQGMPPARGLFTSGAGALCERCHSCGGFRAARGSPSFCIECGCPKHCHAQRQRGSS